MGNELGAVITNGQTTGASITGPWVRIQPQQGFSFQLKWTGTTTGTMTFEVSNDDNPNSQAAIMGKSLLPTAFPAAGNPAGAAGDYPFDFGPLTYRWIRYVFTRSAGTGLMYAAICGNGAAS